MLQSQWHPHIWWFQSQLDSNSLTAAVVVAVVSTSAVKQKADLCQSEAGGMLCGWPLVSAPLIIDTQFHHHWETDSGFLRVAHIYLLYSLEPNLRLKMHCISCLKKKSLSSAFCVFFLPLEGQAMPSGSRSMITVLPVYWSIWRWL